FPEQNVPSLVTREAVQSSNNGFLNELSDNLTITGIIANTSVQISGNINRPSVQNPENNNANVQRGVPVGNVSNMIYPSDDPNNNIDGSPAVSPSTQKVLTRDPPSAAEPASWQIPPSALQPKKNLKSLQFEKYEARISENVHDTEAWLSLLAEVQAKADIDKSRQWVQYAEYELKHEHYDRVENIFARCLRSVLSVDLWKFYLNYVRRMNQVEKGSATSSHARATISATYEYVLNHVGLDKDAGTLWCDYLFFLKTGETHNTWEEQQKMDIMRKAYQKAICIPLNNVELIWKEYDQFENALNKVTAKKFLQDRSPSYMTARAAVKEMRRFTDKINKNVVPTPPKWSKTEREQLSYWKEWIEWEKSNPLALEDQSALTQRIIYVYKQAMMYLRFYPEIWFEAANYWASIKKEEETVTLLKTAMEIMPNSFLVHFAYAELQEHRKQHTEARQAYESLLSHVQSQIEEIEKSTEVEVRSLMQSSIESVNEDGDTEMDGETREQLRIKEKEREKERVKLEESKRQEIDELAKACGLTWIMLMRFTRRTEGIKAARAIFSRARKSRHCTYHVFVASALMEYHCSKDQSVAGKIFELGLKNYADNPEYVAQYLDFLIQLNDDNTLFERTLMSMPVEKAKILWKRFSEYENKYGDLTAIRKIDERRSKEYPEESTLSRFADRYSFLDTNVILKKEVGPKPDPETIESPPSEVQNEEEQDSAPTRRALLDSVHPEKYPRPDFRQWVLYKPTAEQLRRPFFPPPVSSTPGSTQQVRPSPPPASQGVSHGPSTITSPPSTQNLSQPAPFNWTHGPNGMMLPDVIVKFLSVLPAPSSFNGQIINPTDLIELLLNSVPSGGLLSGPPSHSLQPPIQQSRDRSRGGSPARGDGRGYGGDGRYGDGSRSYDRNMESGRGGSGRLGKQMRGSIPVQRGRGISDGGSQFSAKRRRRDFDGETEEFQGRGGPGINRPPDYDLFRARQQKKRVRNESYGPSSAAVGPNE
ncbi:14377_t:CDS:10, partial [Acaulospora colombiana]